VNSSPCHHTFVGMYFLGPANVREKGKEVKVKQCMVTENVVVQK